MRSLTFLTLACLAFATVVGACLDAEAASITISAFDSGHELRGDSTGNVTSEDRNTTVLGRVSSTTRVHRSAAEFDLSAIPDGATITSVEFKFDVTGNDANSTDYNDGTGDLSLHELTTDPDKANGWNWVNSSFGPDQTGGSGGDDVPWGTAGGDLSASHSTIADTTFDPTTIVAGTTLTFPSSAGLVAAVQSNLADDLLYLVPVNGSETAGTARSFLRVAQVAGTSDPGFRIDIQFIPEPASILLVVMGLALGLGIRKR